METREVQCVFWLRRCYVTTLLQYNINILHIFIAPSCFIRFIVSLLVCPTIHRTNDCLILFELLPHALLLQATPPRVAIVQAIPPFVERAMVLERKFTRSGFPPLDLPFLWTLP